MHKCTQHRLTGKERKCLKRRKELMSSIRGVSHFTRRTKRRLYFKLQLWMWRKRQKKYSFALFRAKKQVCCSSSHLSVKTQKRQRGCQSGCPSSSFLQNTVPEGCSPAPAARTEGSAGVGKSIELSPGVQARIDTVTACALASRGKEHVTLELSERGEADGTIAVHPASIQTEPNLEVMKKDIHEFLDNFYRMYGSFIPLQKTDVLKHLRGTFNVDFSNSKNSIFPEVDRYRTAIVQNSVPSFQVVYKKHTLTLDDLCTLADQNWLNDQVMNMYGELMMDSANHEVKVSADYVHFLNSFFHRQLMTKGYDGVKRWTKQVDLFSKSLLLVPVHLEVHWCLVAADNIRKRICLYDSQGNALQKVARNVLKYLMTEAKERKQTAFENGWTVSFDEEIPQQSNENDCGVFVLEYSRCLTLGKPLSFSQRDIPKIRKRIYKELCDCKIHLQD